MTSKQALAQHRQNPLENFKPRSGQQVLEELRGVNELATAKGSLQDAEAFRRWLLAAAQSAADAGKEGGFLGFGTEQVSAGERRMLDQVRGVLGMPGAVRRLRDQISPQTGEGAQPWCRQHRGALVGSRPSLPVWRSPGRHPRSGRRSQ